MVSSVHRNDLAITRSNFERLNYSKTRKYLPKKGNTLRLFLGLIVPRKPLILNLLEGTLDTLRYTRFPSVRLQPLGHLSAVLRTFLNLTQLALPEDTARLPQNLRESAR